jgi:thiosulfate reductase cytochrome b subunit
MISRTNVPATCGKCHQSVATQFQQSIHAEAAARGVREAPVCNDCHGEHRILARTEPHSPVFAANIPGETCGRCHGSARLTEKFGLAPDQVRSFRDSFHGLALRAGQITAANCASCHGVHDITPSSDPRSHVHPANVPATCGKCHPGAGARFVLGPVHVVPASTTIPILYWIRFIYLWVISLTVFFMLAHNALDLSRKARRRELFPSVPLTERPERMSRELRWQHGLVMFSFPILVYTGFALTYPESWWAAPLLVWESQLGLRGALHRVASFVLLASLFWHLIHLGVSRELRRKLRELRPTAQDCRDLIAVLRFNLGLTPIRPGFGKFSYVEKIEYWAFIWGMVIMTASGLLLWFENFTLRYLPKIATDIATAIHFYEAALATLAIVVWHFYWVIFDPDVYPMDSSWWHGRPPAARSAERNRGAQSADAAKTTEESNSRGQS